MFCLGTTERDACLETIPCHKSTTKKVQKTKRHFIRYSTDYKIDKHLILGKNRNDVIKRGARQRTNSSDKGLSLSHSN